MPNILPRIYGASSGTDSCEINELRSLEGKFVQGHTSTKWWDLLFCCSHRVLLSYLCTTFKKSWKEDSEVSSYAVLWVLLKWSKNISLWKSPVPSWLSMAGLLRRKSHNHIIVLRDFVFLVHSSVSSERLYTVPERRSCFCFTSPGLFWRLVCHLPMGVILPLSKWVSLSAAI